MKKTLLIPVLLILGLTLFIAAGCGDKAEAAKCAGCGMELKSSETLCAHCAEKAEAAAAAAAAATEEAAGDAVQVVEHDCATCGMKMAADQMVEVDGKWYCAHCKPATEGAEESHEGHDHG